MKNKDRTLKWFLCHAQQERLRCNQGVISTPKLIAHISCEKTRAGVFTGYQTIHNVCNRFHHVAPMTKTTPVKSQQAQTFSTNHAVQGELLLYFHFIRGPSQVGQ